MELWTQLKPQDPPFAHIPYVAGSQADMEHDAAYAHALVKAIEEWSFAMDERKTTVSLNCPQYVEARAACLMREWGFEERARS